MQRIRIEIDKIINHFTPSEQRYIHDIVNYSEDSLSKKSYFFLFKCMKSIDDSTPQNKKTLFIEMLEQILLKDTQDNIDVISSGENFFIEIRLRKEENLSGSIILARDEDNVALSSNGLFGSEDTIQRIDLFDLDLASGTFHKIRVLAESPNADGVASGDGISLINIVYLYVLETIDQ